MRKSPQRKQEKIAELKPDLKKIPCPKHDLKSDEPATEQEVCMVLRTVFIPPSIDRDLRSLAFDAGISKNELIRTILMANPKLGNCKRCAEDLERWKMMNVKRAKKVKNTNEEVAFRRHTTKTVQREYGYLFEKRANWFARAVVELTAELAFYYGARFRGENFAKWLVSPYSGLAKQKPAMVIWLKGNRGLREVKRLVIRLGVNSFS